ncbi:MAG: hypothetical protein P4M00_01870 [Azospirillaceae bacterium]|nr:hypothetical protein [Azospirillaceae bacterium]
MRYSMWTYPWDLQDLGCPAVLRELQTRAGVNGISMATSYHAGHFLQPRSPQRKVFFPEDGTIYFLPTAARWQDLKIQPKLADVISEGGDVLASLIRQRDAGGLAVSCWTVCLHNTRLGLQHPAVVTRNAFGDPNPYNLCPSHPDVRAYVTTMVEDVTHRYKPDSVELESPGFMGFAHEAHHEKDAVGLTAEDDFLLSLCFCPACLARAAAAGVDGGRARLMVRRWLTEALEREVPQPRWPDFPAGGPALFSPWPEVQDYVLWRFEPVTSLVRDIRDRADPASRIHVIDLKDGWRDGCDIAAIGTVCDGAVLCAYNMEPETVGALMIASRKALGPDRYLGAGLRLGYPEMKDRDAVAARVQAAVAGGADGVNFYNYGLVPQARLDWVRHAIEGAARAAAAPPVNQPGL